MEKLLETSLDSESRTPLSVQLENAIKKAIVSGEYGPGDVLPGIHELTEALRVSERVPRMALKSLANQGWTSPRRGVGSVGRDRGLDVHESGRVLVYLRAIGYSYYFAELVSALSFRLLSSNWRVTTIVAGMKSEKYEKERLASLLKERWSLVMPIGAGEDVWRIIAESGWPMVRVGGGARLSGFSAPSEIGHVELTTSLACGDLVRACVRRRVGRVAHFDFDAGAFEVAGMFRYVGIEVESVHVPRQPTPEDVTRKGLAAMRRFLARRPRSLPDLFLFADDFLAQGALLALMEASVRVPEDVKVVTLANLGLGPVYVKSLARLEMNPLDHARTLAAAVMDYLASGTFPAEVKIGSTWREGETF